MSGDTSPATPRSCTVIPSYTSGGIWYFDELDNAERLAERLARTTETLHWTLSTGLWDRCNYATLWHSPSFRNHHDAWVSA